MKAVVISVLLLRCSSLTAADGEDRPLPGGWNLHPYHAANLYRIGIDREIRHGGKSAAFLESQDADAQKYQYAKLGAVPRLVQTIDATTYRGKRLRLSAFLKSKDVQERAYFAANVPNPYADLEDRFTAKPPLEGTTDWKRYEIEFTVIAYAKEIEVRVGLSGPGRVWIDDLRLEVLGDAGQPPYTGEIPKADPLLFGELANTDFEQTELEYQMGLMQGLWETTAPAEVGNDVARTTLLVKGNKQTNTFYDTQGNRLWEVTFDFAVERSGRMSLITRRNPTVTFDATNMNRYPEHWPDSFPFTVNRRLFVQIFLALDGSQGPPVLARWYRVEK